MGWWIVAKGHFSFLSFPRTTGCWIITSLQRIFSSFFSFYRLFPLSPGRGGGYEPLPHSCLTRQVRQYVCIRLGTWYCLIVVLITKTANRRSIWSLNPPHELMTKNLICFLEYLRGVWT
jgi:hypothetical protein